ncbi:DMT family transporter [Parvularcula sp. ZS-1/3]|uniref:DMT family transporter n=1 Tax=Parvularcula mediterranea TaxID=2732508 RepID=A0A7Y3W5T3_9PROT|nr:DMT family transporter [Parvularcula mediterranea]NNU17090.1 DMT family transporter [Parvularcula mediterranea]
MLKTSILVGLTLLAFSGNSLLTRYALLGERISPEEFGLLRLASGAAVLLLISAVRGAKLLPRARDLPGAASLFVYVAAFSLAYVALDAGLGALVLFGAVQLTTIGWGLARGERLGPVGAAGILVALGGLLWLLKPEQGGAPLWAMLLMLIAGAGWGVYTLLGRGSDDPVARNARNFALASVPATLLAVLLSEGQPMTTEGAMLAILSGSVTSGLGYALWYQVLPKLSSLTAGTVQLLVPPMTAGLGALLLSEAISVRFILASALILGGVLMTFRTQKEG